MKRRISLKLNNKGSGIVTVLIAVVLLTLMGSLLLMLAYTGFEMKSSDRLGKQNVYDASTAMDEIKVGIQEAVSKSIETSYGYALKRYSEKGTEIQSKFAEQFISSFEAFEKGGKKLITKRGDGYWYYNLDAISDMIVNCREGVATVKTTDDNARVEIDTTNLKIVFKNIIVSYTNKDRTTTISADINVAVPDIGYSLSQFTVSGVPSFAAIVGGELKQDGSTTSVTEISGGAYMRSLTLLSNAQVIFRDGIFVCREDANISGTYTSVSDGEEIEGRLIVDPEATFWSNNIIMNDSSTVRLLGNTYVNNDLKLEGRGSKVTLSGTYTGFGTGGSDGMNANESSSIIVNGKHNKIDMEGLSQLILAGFSFVGKSPVANDGEGEAYVPKTVTEFETGKEAKVKMGESISVKENQKVYLAPVEYLTYVIKEGDTKNTIPSTNPDVFPDTDSFIKEDDGTYTILSDGKKYTVTLDTTKALWGTEHKFSEYGAKLQPICMVAANQLIVYYFIAFTDTAGVTPKTADENASQYFRDYAEANPVEINNYINKYIEISNSQVASQAMGNFFVGNGENLTFRDFLANNQSAAIKSNSALYEKYFDNICQTLSYNESSSDPDDNPFTYFINVDKIEDEIEGTQEFKDENGKTIALIVNGNYTYNDASSSDIHLIIATGSVTVKKTFNGLIFSNNKLLLDADTSLSADSKEVEKGYVCKATIDGEERMVGDYFKVPIGESSNWGSGSGSVSGKSVESLVTYSNWKKS